MQRTYFVAPGLNQMRILEAPGHISDCHQHSVWNPRQWRECGLVNALGAVVYFDGDPRALAELQSEPVTALTTLHMK